MADGADGEWFWRQRLADGLYLIRERFYESGNRANMWLVQGSERDLVVDAGLGLSSLPDYLERAGLTGSRPLLALATHIHFDHAGGLHHFPAGGVAVHRAEAAALSRGDNLETVTWLSGSEVSRPPPGWTASSYRVRAVQPGRLLEDGDVIELGDRQLTVLHTPGHSRGSICLHEPERGLLFSGDTVYQGALIDWLPHSNINHYKESCRRLLKLLDRGQVSTVLPGHFNPFGPDTLHTLASDYIAQAGLWHKVATSAISCVASIALRANNLGR
ncbi:metallo-beta-lactamase domain-containing protein 2-like [Scyliorhinus canicula]|uniref:metallo-beta-lactamase domain-containing protein 2-like n=1 Tax=Scyliorhinus canicula TaxID=7830 RepID=UPI0018F580A0|nr:metallo-beta-lactamase domain-containing protein 2-like [Scyliorhinus canicula]